MTARVSDAVAAIQTETAKLMADLSDHRRALMHLVAIWNALNDGREVDPAEARAAWEVARLLLQEGRK